MRCGRQEQGFILPLAVLLVIVLTISGTAFMQHDYLERRMAMNNVDNQGGFYLANAGFERSREVFKIDTSGSSPTWNAALSGTPPYALDPSPGDPLLCDPTKNCVIPPFGSPVSFASTPNLPFDGLFDDGSYSVRAFNDDAAGETSTVDLNGILVVRALGTIRGEQKLIQAEIQAISALGLINCR